MSTCLREWDGRNVGLVEVWSGVGQEVLGYTVGYGFESNAFCISGIIPFGQIGCSRGLYVVVIAQSGPS